MTTPTVRRAVPVALALLLGRAATGVAQTPVPAALPVPASTEVLRSGATGMHYQGFNFAEGSDVASARLRIFPFAWQARLGPRLSLDGYAAYAVGTVHAVDTDFTLQGPVDSWARLRWAARPGMVIAVGINFPTGVEKHTAEEAIVANVLSNDLLGFREGNWGAGASGTFGISTVRHLGRANMTLGASFRTAGGFVASTDTNAVFNPGSEGRVRVGFDAPVKGGRFESGLTVQRFTTDQLDRKNLFQSGLRIRGDFGYRRGAWSFFAADLLRQRGDLTLPVVSIIDGSYIRDTSVVVGWQNLVILGANRGIQLTPTKTFTPSIELKIRSREERFGRGWITAFGGTLPVVVSTVELFPSVKVTRGLVIPAGDQSVARALTGLEISFIARRAQRALIGR
jgi:hypothetical protein